MFIKPQATGISIHASEKEATGNQAEFDRRVQFQSTPPRRRRQNSKVMQLAKYEISIHASEKEATPNVGIRNIPF